jgi:hypothetical protein
MVASFSSRLPKDEPFPFPFGARSAILSALRIS